MIMASMLQACGPNEHYEGSSSPAMLFSSSAFDSANPFTWQPISTKSCSPPMEGPFTPTPFTCAPSQGSAQLGDGHSVDDGGCHDYAFMTAIAKSMSYSELLSFSSTQLPTDLDMEYLHLAEEMELGLQRQQSICSGAGYGADKALSNQASDHGSLMREACSYGDGVKLRQLARSLTFPTATARAQPWASSDGGAISLDADMNNNNNGKFEGETSEYQIPRKRKATAPLIHPPSVSPSPPQFVSTTAGCELAATTSCSGGQPDCPSNLKVSQIKAESLETSHCQTKQEHSLHLVGTTKGLNQSKKRSSIIGTTIASVKRPHIETPPDVVHVRARRGQATDSHSLAERVRREKISQRMKVLQEIVPGCQRVLGKAMMLDEIINYVKSLQRQVEFLSMKLAAANQAGVASMILDKANYIPSSTEIFGELRASQHQLIQLEPLISSLMQ